jgi:hypothetical protein
VRTRSRSTAAQQGWPTSVLTFPPRWPPKGLRRQREHCGLFPDLLPPPAPDLPSDDDLLDDLLDDLDEVFQYS